jgi:Protein of unknown function (DUF935)
MAKKLTNDEKNTLVINKLTISQLNRTPVDIGSWSTAVRGAESITHSRRKQLYELYHNAMSDGWLKELVKRRIRAITNIDCSFVKADGTVDKKFNKQFKKLWFKRLLEFGMEAMFYGHSLIEFEFDNVTKTIQKTVLIPRQNVSPEFGVIMANYGDYQNNVWNFREEPYRRYMIEHNAKDELGILLQATLYVLLKRGNMGDWATFNEMFGSPIRTYKYNPQFPESRVEAENSAKAAGNAAYIVLPEGVEFALHNGNSSGQTATYKDLRDAMNEELSISIVGQTLTVAQGNKGARSLGEVHQAVQEEMHKEDRKEITFWLNEMVLPILRNYGYNLEEGGEFMLDDTQVLPIADQLDMDIKLVDVVDIPADYFYDKYKIPKPKGQEKLAGKAPQPPIGGAKNPLNEVQKKKSLSNKDLFQKS